MCMYVQKIDLCLKFFWNALGADPLGIREGKGDGLFGPDFGLECGCNIDLYVCGLGRFMC